MPSVTVEVCEKACAAYKALRELSEDRDCFCHFCVFSSGDLNRCVLGE